MRHQHTLTYIALTVALAGCAGPKPQGDAPKPPPEAPAAKVEHAREAPPAEAPPATPPDPLAHRDDLPPEKRVVVFVDGEERTVS